MVAFKYKHMKPIKRLFKVWVICWEVNRYMLNFEINKGKSESDDEVRNLDKCSFNFYNYKKIFTCGAII